MSTTASVQRSQRRKKEFAVDMMGGECQICGYDKCINALEFHHVNDDKKANPSYIVMRWSWERVKPELEKCIMVCANCHRELHYTDMNLDYENLATPFHVRKCNQCGNDFETRKPGAKFCSMLCSSTAQRKVERPDKETLECLLKNGNSWVNIGKSYNVSDNTVKKWAKKCKLPSTTKELKDLNWM